MGIWAAQWATSLISTKYHNFLNNVRMHEFYSKFLFFMLFDLAHVNLASFIRKSVNCFRDIFDNILLQKAIQLAMGAPDTAVPVVPNSQGHEQIHAVLDKALESLRMKNYKNFARGLIMFFAIR